MGRKVRDISHQTSCTSTEFVGGRRNSISTPSDDDDISPFRRESLGSSEPDATVSSGDNSNFV
jgi:hypothetical protein